MSSNLRAALQELTYYFLEDGDIKVKEAKAAAISLSDIADAVIQNPSEELEKSILTGMQFPVIVCNNTEEEYEKAVVGLSNKKPYDPSKKYLVLIGNQRITIARKYFESIDAFIVDRGIESLYVKHNYESVQ
jgi:hypothetical protein